MAWDVTAATLLDALDRYLIGMADFYEVPGISEHDRANVFNVTHSTMSAFGGIGPGPSVRQTLSRGKDTLRRSGVDGLNMLVNWTVRRREGLKPTIAEIAGITAAPPRMWLRPGASVTLSCARDQSVTIC